MPNTPAQLGRGMTVWYATPETSAEQRAQAASPPRRARRRRSRSTTRSSSRWRPPSPAPARRTCSSSWRRSIDAAVHLGFARHVAHDLVIETLEGSTLFAKQSGMHPAQLRNMVTSPGGTSAAALHELESGRLRTVLSEAVWAAFGGRSSSASSSRRPSASMPAGPPHPTKDVPRGSG